MNRVVILLLVLGVLGGVLHVKNRYIVPAVRQAALASQAGQDGQAGQAAAAGSAARPANGQVIEVYGRNACGYTRRMLAELQAAQVPVAYHDIDAPAVEAAFQARFADAGLMHNGSYALPVVAVAGQSLARPSPGSVIYRYNAR